MKLTTPESNLSSSIHGTIGLKLLTRQWLRLEHLCDNKNGQKLKDYALLAIERLKLHLTTSFTYKINHLYKKTSILMKSSTTVLLFVDNKAYFKSSKILFMLTDLVFPWLRNVLMTQ